MGKGKQGTAFEVAVMDIQKLIDPNSNVSHDEKIIDKYGHPRQFDVVIRGELGGRKLLGVIECKDWKAKVDLPVVDAFITKMRDINANFGMIFSNSGFTRTAIEKCAKNDIGVKSLLQNDNLVTKVKIKYHVYLKCYDWRGFKVRIFGSGPVNWDPENTINDMFIGEQNLLEWFQYHLDSMPYLDVEGPYEKEVEFSFPQVIQVRGHSVVVQRIVFMATRVMQLRHTDTDIKGNGVFDWNENSMSFPENWMIDMKVPDDPSQWEEYNGPIREGFDIRFGVTALQYSKEHPPLNIEKL
ncbi:restriction endonuclease [Paenibacillus amylolyticus]|uniref:Restriction endonuclease n=1 Tax=Paenibacillus amylolyticus TaxID=1451 RepID=A0A5M9WLU2_PAEAM|nr:restriction endonuclease [Paenibacillus amylolyticus]KAA8782525.1 restriction endonuclease [Paenibacillus amylolyticus]